MSNIACFGDPVCSCSLKQGIREGEEVEDCICKVGNFDCTLVIDGRTEAVVRKVSQFLKESGKSQGDSFITPLATWYGR